ncbi:MAG: TetR/AcrR family transcriptional regulator [bacterium]|nr:TetR/AcrR family transcriptional regulator [bacterium]
MVKCRLKSEERRKQILEKAAEVFAKHGLAGARTRDIAKACNINEAVIYKHFESKEELFRESLQIWHAELAKTTYEVTENQPNGLAALKAFMDLQIVEVITNPEPRAYILHGVAAATLDPLMKEWATNWFYKQNKFTQEQLERGIGDGSIRPDIDVEAEVWHIKGVGWACLLAGIFGLSNAEVSDLARKLYKSVLDSVAVK